MKKLLFVSALATATSFSIAGEVDKISTDFDSLDNNDDAFVSMEEADDNDIWTYFKSIDSNADGKLSKAEYNKFVSNNPSVVEKDLLKEMHEEEMEEAE